MIIIFAAAKEIISSGFLKGELAQLVERLHGMQEVSGSTPLFSTSFFLDHAKPGLYAAHDNVRNPVRSLNHSLLRE